MLFGHFGLGKGISFLSLTASHESRRQIVRREGSNRESQTNDAVSSGRREDEKRRREIMTGEIDGR